MGALTFWLRQITLGWLERSTLSAFISNISIASQASFVFFFLFFWHNPIKRTSIAAGLGVTWYLLIKIISESAFQL